MTDTNLPSKLGFWGLAAMICALSGAFFLEWHAAQASAGRLSEDLRFLTQALGRQQEALEASLEGFAKANRATNDAMSLRLEARLRSFERSKVAQAPPASEGSEAAETELEALELEGLLLTCVDAEDFPPLPDGESPAAMLAEERLPDLVRRYRGDPERSLNGIETAEALNIMAETRAMRDVLRSRSLVATLGATDVLRSRGEYLEFAPGEPYHQEPGVLSHGEGLGERGMRLFYLFPEEFPELYAMKEERRRVSEVGARRLLALIQSDGG